MPHRVLWQFTNCVFGRRKSLEGHDEHKQVFFNSEVVRKTSHAAAKVAENTNIAIDGLFAKRSMYCH